MIFTRRKFISGLTALSCAAMFRKSEGLSGALQDPCDTTTFDIRYKRKKKPDQLGISFLGTFAIFVTKTNIVAYTPKVADDQGNLMHNYWLAQPYGKDGEKSRYLAGLQGNNAPFTGIDSNNLQDPQFVNKQPDATNAIDSDVNLVVTAAIKSIVNPQHTIVLPLPDDILLAGWSQKDTERIFASSQLNDFCFLARDHIFAYNPSRFNSANLTYNGATVKADPTLSLRFLSEPVSDKQVIQECEGSLHIERAMSSLATMMQMNKDALKINVSYCNQQQLLDFAPRTMAESARTQKLNALDSGPGAISASRFPACQAAIVNGT